MNSPFPDVIRIETSSRCNFNCIHCPTSMLPNKREILSREKFQCILDQFGVSSFTPRVVVLYHGGEPLINVNLEHFIAILKNMGVKKTVITTNGSMLTEARSVNIIKSGLDYLKVSFDGETPEENDLIRRNGKFSCDAKNVMTFLKARKELKRTNPVVAVCNIRICNRDTLDHLNRLGDFAFPQPPNYLSEYFRDVFNEIEFQSYPAMVWPSYTEFGDFDIVTYASEKPKYCANLFETITVLSNGDVVPCCYDLHGDEVFGNIFKTDIFSIWNNERHKGFRSNFKKGIYSDICNKCNLVVPRYLCKKRPGSPYFSNKNM